VKGMRELPIACAYVDADGHVTDASEKWMAYNIEMINARHVQAAAGTGSARFELPIHKSAQPTVFLSITLICQADGRLFASATDVSHYKVALNSAADQWLQLYNTNPTPGSLWNSEKTIIDCNEAMVKLLGISGKEEYVTNFHKYVPEIQPNGMTTAALRDEIHDRASESGYYEFPWAYVSASGEYIPGQAMVSRIVTTAGDIYAAYLIDSRQVDAVKRQGLNMHMMLDYAPIAVNLYNSAGMLLDCNDACAQLFGYQNKNEFMQSFGKTPEVCTPTVQPSGIPSPEYFKIHSDRALISGREVFEFMYTTSTGEELPVEITVVYIPYENDFMLATYIRDMRDVVAVRRKNEEADVLNQTLIDAAPYVIGLWDDQGKIVVGNERCKEFFGVADPSMVAENLYAYSPPLQPCGTPTPVKAAYYYQLAQKKGYAQFEWVHRRTDGELIPCECVYKIYSHQGKKFMLSYTVDLRQVKKAMEDSHRAKLAEANNLAKSQFLARMSHEIRTPIASVLGISEIQLHNTQNPPTVEEAFGKIHSSAEILLNIINDILDLSRVEAGKMTISNRKYELASMISDILHVRHNSMTDKALKFICRFDQDLPAYLEGDAVRIGQVVNNLLSNAFKYTEKGSVTLRMNSEPRGKQDDITLVITISDTGFGMNEAQLNAMLHNEYIRLHEDRHKTIMGTGLGIPIVMHMVKLMDAEINYESKVDEGTTVTVRIPQKRVGKEILGQKLAQELQQFKFISRAAEKRRKFDITPMPYGRVLVVDDIEANLYVAQGLLAFYDLNVEICNSGQEAIIKVKKGKIYDIIFMDHMMPDMNGVETMRALRGLGCTVPIVALTANALIGKEEEFMQAGFDGFLAKPINIGKLNTILIKHVHARQPAQVIEIAAAVTSKRQRAHDIVNFQNDDSLIKKIRANFIVKQANAYERLTQSIEKADIKGAHLLVHTLKGLAGLIHETELADMASDIELQLERCVIPPQEEMDNFRVELDAVLARCAQAT